MTNTLATWFLITVTGGGLVGNSTFSTEHACMEARSIALFGMTMADVGKAEALHEANIKKQYAAIDAADAKWLKSHPCMNHRYDSFGDGFPKAAHDALRGMPGAEKPREGLACPNCGAEWHRPSDAPTKLRRLHLRGNCAAPQLEEVDA